ncbi:MAG TPA: NADH-quinone oxidoreductase subunit H [bacterium]|nr:NADH-quinone oxidoreductase subunit H [bacterium]
MMQLFYILIFPGFLFLYLMSFILEYEDRIIYARLQNRKGPPLFQPLADFIKLLAKEDIVPECADKKIFKLMPMIALTAVVTSFFYIPIWGVNSLYPFKGDLIVVLYLLTIPTVTFFLAGWSSTSLYSTIGAVRTLTQLFSYEVLLFLSVLSPAMLADSWSLGDMASFYNERPAMMLFNIVAFGMSLVAMLGKLEKVPFDIAEAETEIVGGTFTEYSGRLFAFFRMAINMEMVVGASLIAAVFLPFGLTLDPVYGFMLYIVKVFFVIFFLSVGRTVFARLRIDQMVSVCWKYFAPIAFAQIVLILIVKGVVL